MTIIHDMIESLKQLVLVDLITIGCGITAIIVIIIIGFIKKYFNKK